jgi:arabinose-5-phosphate isomerase
MNLVPTASTTAALALGDALAMTLLVAKGFREEDFANLHPGGKLGKRLMRVERLMLHGGDAPIVRADTPMPEVMREMSDKKLGMTCVVDGDGRLAGVITDGDLRRHMIAQPAGGSILERRAAEVMTRNPVTITRGTLAVEALRHMEERRITSIVVVDAGQKVEGIVHLHDLWRTQLF